MVSSAWSYRLVNVDKLQWRCGHRHRHSDTAEQCDLDL